MMTSRSEYRLLLRQDNADLRLSKIGYDIGLISEERYQKLLKKEKEINEEIERLSNIHVGANTKVQEFLIQNNSAPLQTSATMAELIRRPELDYELTAELDDDRKTLNKDVREQVNINIKYEGYIRRQESQVKQFKKLENKKIPANIDYSQVNSLRIEAVQKLSLVRPASIGQASRISGVSPADITVLLVYLETYKER
jgi:tRNA uridine 5-carboxymethylaminomethyl modification enzyme mnmG